MNHFTLVFLLLVTIASSAQDRMVRLTATVKRGGNPNYIQHLMVFATDTANEMGITVAVRPGATVDETRIMYLDITGPMKKIEDFTGELKEQAGVTKVLNASDELPRNRNEKFVESTTRKFKVTGTGKMLSNLLNAVKKTAGQSKVVFMDASPNVGGTKRFVTIQVKGLLSNLDDFESRLKVASGVSEVTVVQEEDKD